MNLRPNPLISRRERTGPAVISCFRIEPRSESLPMSPGRCSIRPGLWCATDPPTRSGDPKATPGSC